VDGRIPKRRSGSEGPPRRHRRRRRRRSGRRRSVQGRRRPRRAGRAARRRAVGRLDCGRQRSRRRRRYRVLGPVRQLRAPGRAVAALRRLPHGQVRAPLTLGPPGARTANLQQPFLCFAHPGASSLRRRHHCQSPTASQVLLEGLPARQLGRAQALLCRVWPAEEPQHCGRWRRVTALTRLRVGVTDRSDWSVCSNVKKLRRPIGAGVERSVRLGADPSIRPPAATLPGLFEPLLPLEM
jgi:hypothetical protein